MESLKKYSLREMDWFIHFNRNSYKGRAYVIAHGLLYGVRAIGGVQCYYSNRQIKIAFNSLHSHAHEICALYGVSLDEFRKYLYEGVESQLRKEVEE